MIRLVLAVVLGLMMVTGVRVSETPAAHDTLSSTAPGAASQPAEGCVASVEFTDSRLLALRSLTASTDDLLIDEAQFQALATEIGTVLGRAQQFAPETRDVGVFLGYQPGTMTVGVEGELATLVADAFAGRETVSSLVTGSQAFDSLVARLCLESAARFTFASNSVHLNVSDLANLRIAGEAFRAIAGVSYADPPPFPGDGPDIALEKSGADWYVVFRDAFGDCPAGCIGQKLYYFTVSPTQVKQWCERDALQDPILRRLAETWGPQRIPADPAACESPSPSQEPISLPRTGGSP